MKSFFEFMEKIRREKSINEQDGPMQASGQPGQPQPVQPPANPVAPDATPEQQGAGQTSDPAHDSEFEKLVQIMKSSMDSLDDDNRKRIEDFLKDNDLMDADASADDKGEKKPADAAPQQPADPAMAQAQAGQMAAATPPLAPGAGATPQQ
jgi:hypothetical protein